MAHLLNKSIHNQFLILAARENALLLGWGADISLGFFFLNVNTRHTTTNFKTCKETEKCQSLLRAKIKNRSRHIASQIRTSEKEF